MRTKNEIDRAKNKPNPSILTIVATAAIAKERYTVLFLLLRKKTKDTTTKKINKGSASPSREFCNMRGSKTNIAAPKMAYGLSKNLLQRK